MRSSVQPSAPSAHDGTLDAEKGLNVHRGALGALLCSLGKDQPETSSNAARSSSSETAPSKAAVTVPVASVT
jgi:hypothetical protein